MSIIRESIQKIHAQPDPRLLWLDLAFLLFLVLYVMSGISLVPFHGDESAFLILSEDYDMVMKEHDFEKVLFNSKGGAKQNLRLSTGSVLAFSIGLVRDITDNNDLRKRWLWGASWEENIAKDNLPASRILNLARACSAAMGAAGVVLFFFLAWNLFASRLIAWAASLALVTQGSVLVNIRRAMQEGPKFLSLILTAYIASYVLKDIWRMNARWPRYFLLGAASGLTLAAKQDAAPMLVAMYLALALIPIWKRGTVRIILVNFLYLGATTALAYAFFLAFMPVFWGWWESILVLIGFSVILFQLPLLKNERTSKWLALAGIVLIVDMTVISPTLWTRLHTPLASMLEVREGLVRVQLVYSADQNLFDADTLRNRLPFLLENTVSSRVMYMESPNFDVPPFHELIRAYEDSALSGRTGSLLADGMILVLTLIGGWALLRNFTAEGLFVCVLLLVTGALLFFMIPLSWQRYFLIMQIPYLLFSGVGGNQVWVWIKRLTAPMRYQEETAS